MAVINPTYPKPRPVGVLYVRWALGSGDTGLPVNVSKYPDKTITVDGTFGAAVTLEGTNDERGDPKHSDHVNAPWVPCTDTLDTGAFSKTAFVPEPADSVLSMSLPRTIVSFIKLAPNTVMLFLVLVQFIFHLNNISSVSGCFS